jgi:hypothetical protein
MFDYEYEEDSDENSIKETKEKKEAIKQISKMSKSVHASKQINKSFIESSDDEDNDDEDEDEYESSEGDDEYSEDEDNDNEDEEDASGEEGDEDEENDESYDDYESAEEESIKPPPKAKKESNMKKMNAKMNKIKNDDTEEARLDMLRETTLGIKRKKKKSTPVIDDDSSDPDEGNNGCGWMSDCSMETQITTHMSKNKMSSEQQKIVKSMSKSIGKKNLPKAKMIETYMLIINYSQLLTSIEKQNAILKSLKEEMKQYESYILDVMETTKRSSINTEKGKIVKQVKETKKNTTNEEHARNILSQYYEKKHGPDEIESETVLRLIFDSLPSTEKTKIILEKEKDDKSKDKGKSSKPKKYRKQSSREKE